MFTFPERHSWDDCSCPMCDDLCMRLRVHSIMNALPVAVFEHFLVHMVRPFLLSFSDILPSLFPSHWITDPPLPTGVTDFTVELHNRLPLRLIFVEMCRAVVRVTACRGEDVVDVTTMVKSLTSGGVSIYSRLIARAKFFRRRGCFLKHSFHVATVRIAACIESIRGVDIAFHHLRIQLEELNGGHLSWFTPASLCRFASNVGMVSRMSLLAKRLRSECAIGKQGVLFLDQLVRQLDDILSSEFEARLALAMSLHSRLGVTASVAVLGDDLLPLCFSSSVCEPIAAWHDILS